MIVETNVAMTQLKVLQMNLIYLFKPHQSTNVTVFAIHSLNFFTIIKFQTHAMPLAQLAIYISSHCLHKGNAHSLNDFIEMQYYEGKGKYHIVPNLFFQYPH
jgi:hypothetical protein